MSTRTRRSFAVLLTLAFILTVVACALRIVALSRFEPEMGYYAIGDIWATVLHYLLFAAVLIFLVGGLYLRGRMELQPPVRGILFYTTNALLGAALAAFALFYFPLFFDGALTAVTDQFFLICTICFALLGVFFCLNNTLSPDEDKDKRLLLGLSLPLMCIAQILYFYFETGSQINNPNKLLDQFAFGFTALFFLYQLRMLFGKPRYAAECTFGFIAMVFTAAASIPSMIYTLWHGEFLYTNAAHDVLMLAFFLYTAIRMVRILMAESTEGSTLLKLLEEAENPAEALAKHEIVEQLHDEVQITFDDEIMELADVQPPQAEATEEISQKESSTDAI